jgi:hypothetical protein
MKNFRWSDIAPKNDGDFFYTGKTPGGEEEIVAIVQIVTSPSGKRYGCLFIPQWWRDGKTRDMPVFYSGEIDKWKGMWSGPEFGLTCVLA